MNGRRLVRDAQKARVLEQWRLGLSTDLIAVLLGMDEQEVCGVIEDDRPQHIETQQFNKETRL